MPETDLPDGGDIAVANLSQELALEKMTAPSNSLSVIVPVYNGTAMLERCLESIARSTFGDRECIVVDDASTEDVRSVAERHGARVLILPENAGPARARNRGAEIARGEILFFLDADVCVHPDTLARVHEHFARNPGTTAVIGSYDDTPGDLGFVSQYKNLFHHYVHQNSRRQAWTFWSGCGAIRRALFLEAGGFDERYRRPSVEDIELGFRLCKSGRRIDLDPAIQVTHLKRWTVASLVRTDFFDRALPWLALMLEHRTMPPDLNVTNAHRVSVVLVHALLLLVGLAALGVLAGSRAPFASSTAALATAPLGALLVVLNADLYRFFARKRGVLFAARALPLHWLYYAYCGVAAGVGLTRHLWRKQLESRQGRTGVEKRATGS